MKLLGWGLKDGEDVFLLRREHIEESGKFDARYALWREEGKMKFGVTNPDYSERAGEEITEESCPKIIKFIKDSIDHKAVKSNYKYLGATEQVGSGWLTEIFPDMLSREVLIDEETIGTLKTMKEFIETSKECAKKKSEEL